MHFTPNQIIPLLIALIISFCILWDKPSTVDENSSSAGKDPNSVNEKLSSAGKNPNSEDQNCDDSKYWKDELKTISAHLTNNNNNTIGILILIIGWIITAKESRSFFMNHSLVCILFQLAILMFMIHHAWIIKELGTYMVNVLNKIPDNCRVSDTKIWPNIATDGTCHIVLFAITYIIIAYISKLHTKPIKNNDNKE